MSELIKEFKKEHSGIIGAFKEVNELGVLTKEGHSKLMYLLSDLLKHLWHEDERLYPVLRKASEHNKKLKEILSFFLNGLGVIHEKVLQFMTEYYKGDLNSNFHREYERLFDALSKRIGYEENIFSGEYEELNKL